MPNVVTNTTVIDATRRVRVVLTGQFDGASGQESNVIKVNTWGLGGALNATGHLLSGNANPRASYNVSIDKIEWSVSGTGIVTLAWQGSTNTQFAILSGVGEMPSDRVADMALDPGVVGAAPAHTGNVVLSTLGFGANSGYTIKIDLKKDPKAYNQGQWTIPQDFNFRIT